MLSADRRSRCWMLLAGIPLVTAALGVYPALAREPGPASRRPTTSAAILSPRGSMVLIERLDAALSDPAWRDRHRHGVVLGPRELSKRLVAVAPVARALANARVSIKRAERFALHMKRQASLRAARLALRQLHAVAARHYVPSLVSRAYLSEGFALLLHPANSGGALAAFRLATSIDPRYRPDPDGLPSRAARLLSRAQTTAPPAEAPTMEEMAKLAAWAGVGKLVWVSARAEGSRVEVVAVAYEGKRGALSGRRRVLRSAQATGKELAAMVSEIVLADQAPPQRRAPEVARPIPLVPQSRSMREPVEAQPRESIGWYERWWVWTLVGAVVAGSAVAVTVGVLAETKSNYIFHFER